MSKLESRVVITGMGAVSALGKDIKTMWPALIAGESRMGPVTLFDVSGFEARLAAQLPDSVESALFSHETLMRRVDRMAVTSALEAVDDAGFQLGPPGNTALVFAGGSGSILELENVIFSEKSIGELRDDELALIRYRPESAGDAIARVLELDDENKFSLITACSSGTIALGLAVEMIRSGEHSVVITGASDGLSRLCFAGFNTLRAMDPEHCKPFDIHRAGMNLGEGAGVLVLESLESAQNRNARIHAEIIGYSMTSDAYHITTPDATGNSWARTLRKALATTGISPADVGYINAHGTATPQNDIAETNAIKQVFGKTAWRIPISSIKSMIGHCQFAAGAVEAVVTALAVREGIIPPTINLENPDPECDLDYVPNTARRSNSEIALSCSYGFGGSSSAVVIRRYR